MSDKKTITIQCPDCGHLFGVEVSFVATKELDHDWEDGYNAGHDDGQNETKGE